VNSRPDLAVSLIDHSVRWRKHYQVNEIFQSVQGEGILTGRMATFIRLQGCLVGCEWCDTKYTWLKGGTRMSVGEIMAEAVNPYVIITGGEPTMYNLDSLLYALNIASKFVSLETSGQNNLKGSLLPDHITVSPKHRLDYAVPTELARNAAEFKFVLDEHLTEEQVIKFEQVYPGIPIVLMPEGCPPKKEWSDVALEWIERHPEWRFSDRLQYRLGVP
jgi:organic radical activating enzyme